MTYTRLSDNLNMQQSLKERSLEYAVKALNAGAWIWIIDSNEVNLDARCNEIFGFNSKSVSWNDWEERVIDIDKDHLKDFWVSIPTRSDGFEIEFRISVDDNIKWVRLSGFYSAVSSDKPAFASGMMLDITDEKLFNQKLHEANFTKDKFFSIIAHDLRSPFTSILGFTRLLNEEYDDFSNEERKMMIKQILSSTEITFQLLDNLLTWAKTQLGRTSFTPEYFDIESLMLETVNLAAPQARIKGISLNVMMVEKTKVFADVNMVRTIFRNLLSNAIKFSYEGGMVTVEAKMLKDKMKISVSDTGTGIEPKTLKALFCLDEKVTSSKGTANEKGTGLGLILCKEFVEKNGGTISVESKLGEGSTFSFTIPAEQI